jgi:hypothetical protein
MTQFQTQSPVLPASQNDGITNGREIGAFIVAEVLKTIGAYMLALAGVLSPLYLWAIHTGGHSLLLTVSVGISAVWGAAVLVLFILFRSLFGGVPTLVSHGRDAGSATCGGEIGAFVIAYVIVLFVIFGLNELFLAHVYVALGRMLAPLLGLGVSAIGAVIVFILFLALRRPMVGR